MKKILFVIAAAAMMLVGCTKELTQKVDKIEKDLASLETRVAELEKSLNSEVANLKTLIDAVEKKIVVASATQTSNGWELVLTDGKKVTLKEFLADYNVKRLKEKESKEKQGFTINYKEDLISIQGTLLQNDIIVVNQKN